MLRKVREQAQGHLADGWQSRIGSLHFIDEKMYRRNFTHEEAERNVT